MTSRDFINKKIFWLKNKAFRPHAVRSYNELLKNSLYSDEILYDINLSNKIQIVNYAVLNSDFYKKLYKKTGFTPGDIKTNKDFDLLPTISRSDLSDNFNDIVVSNNFKYGVVSTTGGSTGAPLKVLHDSRFNAETLVWRMLSWWGVSPADNAAFIYRSTKKGVNKYINNVLWWPTRRISLDASLMTSNDNKIFLSKFNKLKPSLLSGYVGGVVELANYVIKNNISVHSPKAIWVTSSPIANTQKLLISQAFNSPVYNQYGTCEVYSLAAESTSHDGLHVFSDCRNIDIYDDYKKIKNNQYGEVVITDFYNQVFPIIKYRVGDRSRLINGSSCDINMPRIDNVKGRVSDNVYLPSGDVIAGEYLTTIFDHEPTAISAFQLIQKRDYSLELNYIPGENFNYEYIVNDVVERLVKTSGGQIPILQNKVSRISHDKGKLRYIISEIKHS
jgi:phenylacetate-CoA ligase